ncbi:S8 family serine peptidase [Shewanella sp. SR44-3]|uniref:S8 family serine peptidase n=1 Tax=Shewanella sp. SR44-3 TaxID=2760936 RepID=UPI0015FD5A98|nr:S8 family serine peptidase [Shewanella sp. SR44-3]MBB1269043.1 S8 family serine peptidase [Shewanella sp. SR44-3]
MRKSLVAISITAAMLAGCGSDSIAPEKVNTPPVSADVTFNTTQSIMLSGQLDGKDAEDKVLFSIVNASDIKLGTLTLVDAASGKFTYLTDATEGKEVVQFKVTDGKADSTSTLTIDIKGGDPLYVHQWHLNNSGQSSFAINRGKAGEDMNVAGAIAAKVFGEGVTVAVVDDGLEIAHPDLKNNVVSGGSYNLITGTIDPTPFSGEASHGTAVGGIIASEGWNDIGGRGVAPKAKLIGFNFLDSDPTGKVTSVQTFENFVKSHGGNSLSDYARVFNQSYGYSVPYPHGFDKDELEIYADVATTSSDGKGAIFVKSAGNGYKYFRSAGTFWLPGDYFSARTAGIPANNGLPFHNSNMSTDNANVYNLVVSAVNAKGELSSYSSVGANIFVTAPGGEYGEDNPAIVTTDREGCVNGNAKTEDRPGTPFHGGLHPLNLDCNYTSTMNGTSSAAPNTSGAVAMIMSANPALTWRDVRHVLATTATKVDAEIKAKTVKLGTAEDALEYTAIAGWETNAAGLNFHNLYGFGRVDVSAAVKAAQEYKTVLGEYVVTDWVKSADLTTAIPDQDLKGASDKLAIEEDLIVEAVQIELTANHLRLPDLAVELISPAGTKSVIMTPYNGMVYQGVMDATDPNDLVTGYDETPMLSNAFYGESTKGEWTLKVIDVNSGDYSFYKYDVAGAITIPNEANGELKGWSIRFHGHKAS